MGIYDSLISNLGGGFSGGVIDAAKTAEQRRQFDDDAQRAQQNLELSEYLGKQDLEVRKSKLAQEADLAAQTNEREWAKIGEMQKQNEYYRGLDGSKFDLQAQAQAFDEKDKEFARLLNIEGLWLDQDKFAFSKYLQTAEFENLVDNQKVVNGLAEKQFDLLKQDKSKAWEIADRNFELEEDKTKFMQDLQTKNFSEMVRQYNTTFGEGARQFDATHELKQEGMEETKKAGRHQRFLGTLTHQLARDSFNEGKIQFNRRQGELEKMGAWNRFSGKLMLDDQLKTSAHGRSLANKKLNLQEQDTKFKQGIQSQYQNLQERQFALSETDLLRNYKLNVQKAANQEQRNLAELVLKQGMFELQKQEQGFNQMHRTEALQQQKLATRMGIGVKLMDKAPAAAIELLNRDLGLKDAGIEITPSQFGEERVKGFFSNMNDILKDPNLDGESKRKQFHEALGELYSGGNVSHDERMQINQYKDYWDTTFRNPEYLKKTTDAAGRLFKGQTMGDIQKDEFKMDQLNTYLHRKDMLTKIQPADHKKLIEYETSLNRLKEVHGLMTDPKNHKEFGLFADTFNKWRNKFKNDPNSQFVRSEVKSLITELYKTSGKQVSDKEMEIAMDALLPGTGQPPKNAAAALEALYNRVDREYVQFNNALYETGTVRNMAQYESWLKGKDNPNKVKRSPLKGGITETKKLLESKRARAEELRRKKAGK